MLTPLGIHPDLIGSFREDKGGLAQGIGAFAPAKITAPGGEEVDPGTFKLTIPVSDPECQLTVEDGDLGIVKNSVKNSGDRIRNSVELGILFPELVSLELGYKLLENAQKRWKRIKGFRRLAEVITGVEFRDGVRVTDQPDRKAA